MRQPCVFTAASTVGRTDVKHWESGAGTEVMGLYPAHLWLLPLYIWASGLPSTALPCLSVPTHRDPMGQEGEFRV